LNTLPDDVLYILFNTVSLDSTPFVPPSWRWSIALVCSRWRRIVQAITRSDSQRLLQHDRGEEDDADPMHCLSGGAVSASAVAALLERGVSLKRVRKNAGIDIPVPDASIVLLLAGRIDKAIAMGQKVKGHQKAWYRLGCALCDALPRDPFEMPGHWCWCKSSFGHCVLLQFTARCCPPDTVARMAQAHCCSECVHNAIVYAAGFRRLNVIGTLITHPAIRAAVKAPKLADCLWRAAGRFGFMEMLHLLDGVIEGTHMETCDDAEMCTAISERRGSEQDNGDDRVHWLASAALGDQPACIDFCHAKGICYPRDYILACALPDDGVAFCERMAEIGGPIDSRTLSSALNMARGHYQVIGPRCALWMLRQPAFRGKRCDLGYALCSANDSFDPESACTAPSLDNVLQTASVVLGKWPLVHKNILRLVAEAITHHNHIPLTVDDPVITFITSLGESERRTLQRRMEKTCTWSRHEPFLSSP